MLLNKVLAFIKENAPHIKDDNAKEWAQELIENIKDSHLTFRFENIDAKTLEEQVMWHCRRLTSFGGSDVAILYMSSIGKSLPFSSTSSAADIVRQKLCLDVPEPDTGATARGKLFEGHVRELYMKYLKRREPGVVRFTKAIDAIQKRREKWKAEHPGEFLALDGSPDDLFITPDRKVILVDYKFPGDPEKAVGDSKNPPLYNRVQLHSYKKLLEESGVDVSNLYMYNAFFNSKSMSLEVGFVHHQNEIYESILDIANEHKSYILDSHVPTFKPNTEFTRLQELPDELKKSLTAYAFYNRASNLIDKKKDAAREEFREAMELNGLQFPEGEKRKVAMPMINVSSTVSNRMNNNKLIEKFVELGGDMEDPELYIQSSSVTPRLANSKKSPWRGMYERIDLQVESYLSEVDEDILDFSEGDFDPVDIGEKMDASAR